ncbi:hypothetical protein NPIL_689341 [Nephila pilipes]|uniref:Uncharacterized protein n=1 Tax=Nephila pilipes TaxID=299642 RepID=A0A8X6NQ35_NEPPI|nr:hypothetical protein NPIL_689341 [Nephila pilipes]
MNDVYYTIENIAEIGSDGHWWCHWSMMESPHKNFPFLCSGSSIRIEKREGERKGIDICATIEIWNLMEDTANGVGTLFSAILFMTPFRIYQSPHNQ